MSRFGKDKAEGLLEVFWLKLYDEILEGKLCWIFIRRYLLQSKSEKIL